MPSFRLCLECRKDLTTRHFLVVVSRSEISHIAGSVNVPIWGISPRFSVSVLLNSGGATFLDGALWCAAQGQRILLVERARRAMEAAPDSRCFLFDILILPPPSQRPGKSPGEGAVARQRWVQLRSGGEYEAPDRTKLKRD